MQKSKSEQELISVIVPVHNGEAYIEHCIKSILNQSYSGIEVIIINDGSTDTTAEISSNIAKRNQEIVVITMEDEGVSAARNRGIEEAAGKYVTFVDVDDRIHPDMLSMLMHTIIDTGADVSSCSFFTWAQEEEWAEGEGRTFPFSKPSLKVYKGMDFIEQGILSGNTRCWGKLYKKDSIGKIRFTDKLTIGEDMMFLLNLALSGLMITETNIPYYGYYRNQKGAMLRGFRDSYMDQITCWEEARDKLVKINPGLSAKAGGIIVESIMLTVGKIALLPLKEILRHKDKLITCRKKTVHILNQAGVKACLHKGCRIKAELFKISPALYIYLYHMLRYNK